MVEMMNQESNTSTHVDVSSFMFFEATGDSEFDSNNNHSTTTTTSDDDPLMDSSFKTSLLIIHPPRFLHDDDAHSCNYDESSSVNIPDDDLQQQRIMTLHVDNHQHNDDNCGDDADDGDSSISCSRVVVNRKRSIGWNDSHDIIIRDEAEEEEEEEDAVEQQRWIGTCKKSKTNVMEAQQDKDRLFWETCLAS